MRVVSLPAANSRLKNMSSSPSVNSGGSSSSRRACTTTDSMSSVGRARFSAMSDRPYENMSNDDTSRSFESPDRKSKPGSTAEKRS